MTKTATKTAAPKTAAKAAKGKTPRQPKKGSAMTNQTEAAQYAKGELTQKASNKIATVTNDKSGSWVCITAEGQPTLTYERNRETKELRALAVVGGSYALLKAAIAAMPPKAAKLANGVDSRNAPHSAKAAADSRKANGADTTAKPAAKANGKAEKARTEKAAKNKQPSRGKDRKYAKGDKADVSKPDTFRRYMLSDIILKHKDTTAAKAAHAKSGKYPTHKIDFNWAAQQGYIRFQD